VGERERKGGRLMKNVCYYETEKEKRIRDRERKKGRQKSVGKRWIEM
jgi:hypothetical protein